VPSPKPANNEIVLYIRSKPNPINKHPKIKGNRDAGAGRPQPTRNTSLVLTIHSGTTPVTTTGSRRMARR
jgi:hypothetical protein